MNEGYTTRSLPNAPPRRTQEDILLDDALGLLHRFALEQTGWRGFFRRWYFSDEPLRHDAANIVRRAGAQRPMPEYCQLVGHGRP